MYRHLFVIGINGDKERQLTQGPWDDISPVWSPDGQELYYRTLTTGALMSAQVTVDPTLTVGSPAQLGDGEYALQRFGQRIYDLFPDGDRFLMFRVVADEPDVIHVVLNAFNEL